MDAVGNAVSATRLSLATLPWPQAAGTALVRFVRLSRELTVELSIILDILRESDEFARFESGYWSSAKVAGNLQHVAKHYIYVRSPPTSPAAFYIQLFFWYY